MKLVGDFFSKFLKLAPPNDALRRAVASAVGTVLGTAIDKGAVKIQNQIAYVEVSSVAKNKIRLERRAILDLVYEKLPQSEKLVRDIR